MTKKEIKQLLEEATYIRMYWSDENCYYRAQKRGVSYTYKINNTPIEEHYVISRETAINHLWNGIQHSHKLEVVK